MKNRKLLLIVSLVMALTMSLGGTLAYLTDRDADVNIFSIGDVDIDLTEDFEQGAELLPGVDIEKIPTIVNEGENDAWVWMTWSIPAALDQAIQGTQDGSSENVIHWNPLGATTEGYVTETRVNNAIEKGYLPEGTTAEDILANNTTWNVFNSLAEGENFYTEVINDVEYNTYVLLYNKALEPGEETLPSIYNVYLDARVDIDPDGNWYFVDKGEVTDLGWNSNEDGAPKIYAAAYAIQKDGFESVKDAYAAYTAQWTTEDGVNNGVAEFVEPATVNSAEELQAALDAAEGDTVIILGDDITGDVTITQKENVNITIDGGNKDFAGVITVDGKSAAYNYNNTGVTIKNVNFVASSISADAYIRLGDGTNATRYTNNVTVSDCTFDATGSEKPVAIKSYTGGDYNLTVTDCETTANTHSLLQVKNIEEGLTVIGCDVKSKNGINLNNTTSLKMTDCTFDVQGYCVRFGESNSSKVTGSFAINNCDLTSANDDGDPVIWFRGDFSTSELSLTGTTLNGEPHVVGNVIIK